jgi:tRNA(Ile)-lysidine synthase
LIRSWRRGDVIRSPFSGRLRKVKQLLSKAGVTGHERATWPVVVAGDDVVWIPGVRRSDVAADPTGRSGLSFICEHINR